MPDLYFLLVVHIFSSLLFTALPVLSESIKNIAAKCNNELGFEGNVFHLSYSDPNYPQKAKCVMACVLEEKGVFKEDGSIDREKEKAIPEEMMKDEEKKKRFLKAIDECDVSAKTNKCETAYEFLKCAHIKANGH